MRPLRLLLVERLDTRFRFNISLNRKGAVAVLAPVGVADSSSLSRRFGTRNCSGNILARLVPATVQLRPEGICTLLEACGVDQEQRGLSLN